MNWNNSCYHTFFSHIYVEEKAMSYPATKQVLARFPTSVVIPIHHYMNLFSSHHQNFVRQKQSPKLILAVKEGTLVYPGAPVCQSFGQEHFYYTSSLMNCPYDCEYCYLQGMYPSANLVLFINLMDILAEVERLLGQHPVYLCISYDTDLLAMEGITGYVSKWMEFAASHPTLTVECRTKSAMPLPPVNPLLTERFILAWTLSPNTIAASYEHHAPSLAARLNAICQALENGYRIRLCFDPMLRIPNWHTLYQELFETVFSFIQNRCPKCLTNGQLADVSLGTFRISKDYLGRMQEARPNSLLVQYPFSTKNKVCSYGAVADRQMMEYAKEELLRWLSEEQLYLWNLEM